jgi:hypothetical protein
MDPVDKYRTIVKKLICEYASYRPSNGQIQTEVVVDPERDHYEVIHIGWDGVRRVHGAVVHIDIIDGEVWIQYNGTRHAIAEELLAAGIPREAIVLGFHPPDVRRHTEFSAGEKTEADTPAAT